MDFLDPKKRRAYHIQLIIGYVLVAIVIGLATVIIVYGANGYGINTKTGQIVQNGLLFTDSKPGGAEIYLNNHDQNAKTASRLILNSGNYNLTLKKTGYHDWSRNFTLSEQSIARYVYPFLFPLKPVTNSLKTYDNLPSFTSQSPDRRWLLVQNTATSTKTVAFDEYDTSTLDQTSPTITSIEIPVGILSNYSVDSKLSEIEWSTDNQHLLLKHDFSGGNEFIIFDRAHPEQSINVNILLGITPTQVSLHDKKTDQLYIFNQTDATLQLADVGAKTLAQPFLKHVLAFKPYGKDLVTYVTDSGEPAGKVEARVWSNGPSYKLNEFEAGNTYLIDAAEFQGHFYYADGSDKTDRINVYKDPLSDIKDPTIGKALPTISLRDPGATKLKFSENTRFIGVESGQNLAIYDIEGQTSYSYTVSEPLSGNLDWMDGHRLIGQTNGNILVMDYDGINKQSIGTTALSNGGFFDRNYNNLLTLVPASDGTSFALKDIDMRAGTDLPKAKQ